MIQGKARLDIYRLNNTLRGINIKSDHMSISRSVTGNVLDMRIDEQSNQFSNDEENRDCQHMVTQLTTTG